MSADTGSAGRAMARSGNDRRGSARSGAGPPSRLRPRARFPTLARDARKRRGQIVDETRERTCQCCRPCDDDVVVTRLRRAREDRARRLAQAPARPVAGHRLTNPPAGRKPQTDLGGGALDRAGSGRRLQDEGRGDPPPTRCGRQELRPPLQAHDAGRLGGPFLRPGPALVAQTTLVAQPALPLRRRAACAPWPGGGPGSGGPLRWPSGRENRAAACGRCCSAGMCASRLASRDLDRKPCARRQGCIGGRLRPVKPTRCGLRRGS